MYSIIDFFLTINTSLQDAAAAFIITGLAAVRILLKKYPESGNGAFMRAGLGAALILRSSVYFMLVSFVPTAVLRGYSASGDLRDTVFAMRLAGIFIIAAAAFLSLSMLSRKLSSFGSKHTGSD